MLSFCLELLLYHFIYFIIFVLLEDTFIAAINIQQGSTRIVAVKILSWIRFRNKETTVIDKT